MFFWQSDLNRKNHKVREMPTKLVIAALLFLGACTSPPVVTGFNGNSVTIQQMGYETFTPEAKAEAERLCATEGKTAEPASLTPAPQKGLVAPISNYLFLCV